MYQNVFVESLAFVPAPLSVTSLAIEDALAPTYQRLGIPKGCIQTLVGIDERRFWPEGTTIDEVAATAAEAALSSTTFDRMRVGLVVSGSVCKDYVEPSVAALVRGRMGLAPTCEGIDVGNACLGFLNGIDVAAMWIEHGRIDAALVVAGESSRHVVESTVARLNQPATTMQDFKDALPTLTLGSGAAAMLLVHRRFATTTHRVVGSVTLADPASATICMGTADWMRTDTQKLLNNGIALADKTWRLARERLGFSDAAISQYICHQVGATHMATLVKALGISVDKAMLTYPQFGNVGPAAIPLTLKLAVDAGRVAPGDRVALMGVGSGLACMMMEVVW